MEPVRFINSPRPWTSAGQRAKADGCHGCRYRTTGTGFIGDSYGPHVKIGLLLPFPSNEELVQLTPLADGIGKMFLSRFVYPLGRRANEVGVSYVLRCRVPWEKGRPAYPTGVVRSHAEESCRMYDARQMVKGEIQAGGVLGWNPDTFIVTFDPDDVIKISAYHRQMARDVQRAFEMADAGRRPMLLAGKESMELVAPWLAGKGGVADWRGSWWNGTWPFTWTARPETKGFKPA